MSATAPMPLLASKFMPSSPAMHGDSSYRTRVRSTFDRHDVETSSIAVVCRALVNAGENRAGHEGRTDQSTVSGHRHISHHVHGIG